MAWRYCARLPFVLWIVLKKTHQNKNDFFRYELYIGQSLPGFTALLHYSAYERIGIHLFQKWVPN